jgi:hypothetical protein
MMEKPTLKTTEPTIICPTCQTVIPLTETLARPIIELERQKLEASLRERAAAIDGRERELRGSEKKVNDLQKLLNSQAADIEKAVQQRLGSERATIAAAENKKAESRYQAQLDASRREHKAQADKIAELQKAELDYRQKSAALAEERRQWELEQARQLDQERDKIRVQAVQDEKKRHQLELTAKDKEVAQLNVKLTEAQQAELQVRQQRESLETEKREFELKVARQLGSASGKRPRRRTTSATG